MTRCLKMLREAAITDKHEMAMKLRIVAQKEDENYGCGAKFGCGASKKRNGLRSRSPEIIANYFLT